MKFDHKETADTSHVLPLLRILPPQQEQLKDRLDSFSYLCLNISSSEFSNLHLIHPPRVALMPISANASLKQLKFEIDQYKTKFPDAYTTFLGIYSGRFTISAAQMNAIGLNGLYQSPLDDELLINRIFQDAPISPDRRDVSLDQLVRANLTEIEKSSIVPFDLYLYLPMNNRVIFYLAKDTVLNEKTVDKFRKNTKFNLYIRRHDLREYQEYTRRMLAAAESKDLSPAENTELIASRLGELMSGFFEEEEYSEDGGRQLLDNLRSFVRDMKNPEQGSLHSSLRNYAAQKMTMATHNQNVAAYSALFGMALGLTNVESLLLGGLLHDVGKASLTHTATDDQEYTLHPVTGASLLAKRKVQIPKEVQDMVLYHHEHTDGTGFPLGTKGDEIPAYAKVCAFANEFDKLTSVRPGFPQLSPHEALMRIAGLDGEPPAKIYDPVFHKPLIDKFLVTPPVGVVEQEDEENSELGSVEVQEEEAPLPATGNAAAEINYHKFKKRGGKKKKVNKGDRLASIDRLLKTEAFYRPTYLPQFKFADPEMQEEVTAFAKQLEDHFAKARKR